MGPQPQGHLGAFRQLEDDYRHKLWRKEERCAWLGKSWSTSFSLALVGLLRLLSPLAFKRRPPLPLLFLVAGVTGVIAFFQAAQASPVNFGSCPGSLTMSTHARSSWLTVSLPTLRDATPPGGPGAAVPSHRPSAQLA